MPALLYIPWFRPEPWTFDVPVVGEVSVHPFGLLVATGILLAASLAERRAKAVGLRPDTVMNLAGHVLIPAFIVAHVFDAIAYRPEMVLEDPMHLLRVWEGISSFGGFFGAIAGAAYWSWRRKLSALAFADPIAWAFPLGWMFGRMGCFVVHDHPGRVTTFFLGVADYEVGYPPYQVRHDLGLYEVIWAAAVMLLFVWLGRRERPRGLYLALLPMLYAPVRFGLDFLRATDFEGADTRYYGLTPAHFAAVALLLVGAAVALAVWRRPAPEIPPAYRWPPPEAEPEVVGEAIEEAREPEPAIEEDPAPRDPT